MGMIVYVYRDAELGDCTLGGISSKANRLCIVNVEGPFKPDATMPGAVLIRGNSPGTAKIVPTIEPQPGCYTRTNRHTMFGGNFAATSDSRFNAAIVHITGHPFHGAVAIHDRIEP